MTTGEALLGQPVRRGEAVWLSEEADITLLDKARRFGIRETGHSFAGRQDPLTWRNWESMIEIAATEAVARSASLLVVDSFAALARIGPEYENDGGAIAQKMAALSAATGKGLAVLLVHHSNATGRPRGSTAFEGSADIVVRLKLRSQTISLKSVSRFAPVELSGRLDRENAPPQLAAVPDGAQDLLPRLSETDELLWQALKEAGRKGITYGELHEKPGLSRFRRSVGSRRGRQTNGSASAEPGSRATPGAGS